MNKFSNHIAIAILLFAVPAHSADLEKICSDPDVRSVQIPRNLSDPSSSFLNYKFKALGQIDTETPVVIYIPGGPGGTSIGDTRKGIPANATLILTDPRGAGCNDFPDLAVSEITTALIARDVSLLIKALGLKHYILYGVSFGTAVATEIAGTTQEFGIPAPESLVLEGVVGEKFALEKESSFMSILLTNITNSLGIHLSNANVDASVNLALYAGQIGKPAFLDLSTQDFIQYASDPDPNARNPLTDAIAQAWGQSALPFSQKVQDAIWCSELADYTQNFSYSLASGSKLILNYETCSKSGPNYFDAANWKISAPIFYFSGTWDTQTPIHQAQYHFQSQAQNKQRHWVVTEEAGHHSLQFNLMDCRESLWNAILAGNVDLFAKNLSGCKAPTRIITSE